MKQNIENKVLELENNGFKVSLNHVFGNAGNIFKGIAGYGILAVIIYGIVTWIISILVGLVIPSPDIDQAELESIMRAGDSEMIKDYYIETFSNASSIASPLISNILSAVMYPILYSIYTMAYKYDHFQKLDFSDIFIHYKDGKFFNLFITTLIIQVVASIGIVLCVIPGFIVYAMWILAIPLIIFADADMKEALTHSMKLAFKDFGSFILLVLGIIGVAIVCAIIGIILCCVGLFVTIPILYVLIPIFIYSMYKEVIGFSDHRSDIEEIGTDIYSDNPYMK